MRENLVGESKVGKIIQKNKYNTTNTCHTKKYITYYTI